MKRRYRALAASMRSAGASLMIGSLLFGMCAAAVAGDGAPTVPQPKTTYADLTHLTFTATTGLTAKFIAPAPGYASDIDAALVIVSTVKGGGIELSANGVTVPYSHLGKRTVNVKTGETQYFFYGVPLQSGPNTITAVPLGAETLRGPAVSETIYGPGDPASIYADFGASPVADGRTVVPMRVWVRDRFGHGAIPGAKVDVTIVSGDAQIVMPKSAQTPEPQDAAAVPTFAPTNAPQSDQPPPSGTYEVSLAPGGYFEVPILPGTISGPLHVRIVAGQSELTKSFYIAPFLRKPFVNGVASVGAGALESGVNGDGIPDGGGSRRERLALFASGKVGKKALLTVAYESQNRLSPLSSYGPFVDDPQQRPYQTYGDASQLVSPIHSNDHLYARLERDRSSLTWGQFDARIGNGDAGAYQQLLSGLHGHLEDRSGRYAADAFTAHNDAAFVSTTLPVTGLGALETPLHADIVVGSDYLQLVALDRRTGAVVSETPLVRNIDYTIDYATGTLRFINIPLPYDQYFNPQVILLQYEYQGPGVAARTTGGSLDAYLNADQSTLLHAGYLNDATGTQNFAVLSESLSRRWNGGGWMLSHATSYGYLPMPNAVTPANAQGGSALEFTLNDRSPGGSALVSVQDTTAGYSNPFGGLSAPGLLAYRASYSRAFSRRLNVAVAADGQRNHGVGVAGAQSDQSVLAQWLATAKLALTAGLIRHSQNIGQALPAPSPQPAATPALATLGQTQAQLGVQYKATKAVSFSVQKFQTLTGSDTGSTQPSQTLAELDYAMARRGRLYLRELWSDSPVTTFANATSAITYGTGSTHSMQFGFDRDLSPATAIDTAYVVNGTGNGSNIYSVLGIQQKVKLSKFLGGALQAQTAHASGSGAEGFSVWGGELGYANAQTARASVSYQTRTGQAGGASLAVGVAGHLSPNVAAVGFIQRAYSSNAQSIDDKLTLAYRPAESDRLISLFSYQRSNGGFFNGGADSVLSFEELFRPTDRVEIAGRYAYALDGNAYYAAHTQLWALRATQRIGARFDVGAETRIEQIPLVSNARSTDFAAEAGYSFGETRAAVGYNFFGSADPTLTGKPQTRGIYVTLTTLIDRVFGWGK